MECIRLLSYPELSEDLIRKRLSKLLSLGFKSCVDLGDHELWGLKVLGKGHSSVVLAAEFANLGYVAVKVLRTDSKRDSLTLECDLMKRATPIAPEIYYCDEEFIIMELIKGVKLGDVAPNITSCRDLIMLYLKVLAAARYLDSKNITHKELNILREHVIIDDEGKIRIIDFESGFTGFACNVCRVFSSLFMRDRRIIECCSLKQDQKGLLLELLSSYKKTNSDILFTRLVKTIIDLCGSSSCECVG
ncbi:MAG: protein kinase [Zestosphaera sp.]